MQVAFPPPIAIIIPIARENIYTLIIKIAAKT
jgi:hypothetical protein